jgi:ubiquinone/menaquinone biosynthesis C-methylase UbiE
MEDNTVDVITSNGVLNPVMDKQVAFSKLFRVMEPGGKKQISDIITQRCEEELVEAKIARNFGQNVSSAHFTRTTITAG